MAEEQTTKQSELEELSKVINELRQEVKGKEKKPWVFTEARKANFEKANAKRIAAAERKRREAADREAFEKERQQFYEMAKKLPTGNVASNAPELTVLASAPNKPPESTTAVSEIKVEKEEKKVQFVEKAIMADEVESVNHEHDHDDGWMTQVHRPSGDIGPSPTNTNVEMEVEQLPPPVPLHRQTNRAAVAADWAENQMAQMVSRKRAWEEAEELARAQSSHAEASYRIGTGAGNHAPYEGDVGYVDMRRAGIPTNQSARHMVSPEEALHLLSIPRDQALRYLAQKISPSPHAQERLLRARQDREYEEDEAEDIANEYLSHTRHHSTRHPSQLHSATHSNRYRGGVSGDQFVWL